MTYPSRQDASPKPILRNQQSQEFSLKPVIRNRENKSTIPVNSEIRLDPQLIALIQEKYPNININRWSEYSFSYFYPDYLGVKILYKDIEKYKNQWKEAHETDEEFMTRFPVFVSNFVQRFIDEPNNPNLIIIPELNTNNKVCIDFNLIDISTYTVFCLANSKKEYQIDIVLGVQKIKLSGYYHELLRSGLFGGKTNNTLSIIAKKLIKTIQNKYTNQLPRSQRKSVKEAKSKSFRD